MRVDTAKRHIRIGFISLVVLGATIVSAESLSTLPLVSSTPVYSAYFLETGGLGSGDHVQISGVGVGEVKYVEVDGDKALVGFTASGRILGEETSLAIKTRTVLGTRFLDVEPKGRGRLDARVPVPVDRTTSPYLLTDALDRLTETTTEIDTDQLATAMDTLSGVLDQADPQLSAALDGVTRFSQTISGRDEDIRNLLSKAESVTGVLTTRSEQVNRLLVDGNTLLGAANARRQALDTLSQMLSAVARQMHGLVTDNDAQMGPVLRELEATSALLERRKDDLAETLKPLSQYATSLGEAVAGGPFFKAYVVNLLPGQYLQPFIDAAFAGQGLSPKAIEDALDKAETNRGPGR